MNEQVLETIQQLEIKKAPETPSLEAANQGYTKKQLTHFIERHELAIAKSWKKAEIVSALTDWMKEAQTELVDSDADLLAFYTQEIIQADHPLDIYNANLSDITRERLLLLIEHGLLFNIDGQAWIPDETVTRVSNTAESKDLPSTRTEDAPEETVKEKNKENTKEIKAPAAPLKKKPTRSRQATHPVSPSVSTEEKLSREKQTRLDYLKKQAKKKKRKKKK